MIHDYCIQGLILFAIISVILFISLCAHKSILKKKIDLLTTSDNAKEKLLLEIDQLKKAHEKEIVELKQQHKKSISDHESYIFNAKEAERKDQIISSLQEKLKKNDSKVKKLKSDLYCKENLLNSARNELSVLKEKNSNLTLQIENMAQTNDELFVIISTMRFEYDEKNRDLEKREKDFEASVAEYSAKLHAMDEILFTITNNMRHYHLYTEWYNFHDLSRIQTMLRDSVSVLRIDDITAFVKSTGDDKKEYKTTLKSCKCDDFVRVQKGLSPCKHMYALAFYIGLLQACPLDENKSIIAEHIEKRLSSK